MKSLRVNPGSLPPVVCVPGSKSYANRALILAALRCGSFTIESLPASTDVVFLLESLKKIGLICEWKGEDLAIVNSFPECEGERGEIEVGEGGTTARFLASMLLLGRSSYTLILGERLKERPWDEFIGFVRKWGGKAELAGNRLTLQGPLALPEVVEMDCSRTTQFASGIRLAFAGRGVSVRPMNLKSSQSYWDMTEELIRAFQQEVKFRIPLDWSSASYPLAFAALVHPISFPGLWLDVFQSDSKFLAVLRDFGSVEEDSLGIRVSPLKCHRTVHLDVSDCLDLVPALAFFLAHVEGKHALRGVDNLIHKESDRLNEVIKLLKIFGRECGFNGETLEIHGKTETMPFPVDLMLPDDHRMVMAGTLFLRHHAGGTVAPSEAVHKSYPDFFKLTEA